MEKLFSVLFKILEYCTMTFYQNRTQDNTFGCRRKTIFKLFIFLCVLGGWCFVRQNYTNCKSFTTTHELIPEDWFDGNITKFQSKANIHNYVVLRKTTIEAHGDFSCSSSLKPRMCMYKVDTLLQAVQICNVYADVCVAFVLTKDMNIRLKHQVRQVNYDSQAATFVKNAFAPRIGDVPSTQLSRTAKTFKYVE